MCFGPIISCKSAAAFCGSKAKFPGGFPAQSRKSSKMFGKFLKLMENEGYSFAALVDKLIGLALSKKRGAY